MSIIDEKSAGKADEAAQAPRRTSPHNPPDVVTPDVFSDGPIPVEAELGAEEDVPPAYSEMHDQFSLHQTGFDAGAAVTDDGRVNININQTSRHLADFIAPALRNQLRESIEPTESTLPPAYIPPSLGGQPGQTPPPRLNVVIQIVGSRGDVQPFVALGQVLKNTYGHRVRVATHSTFQKFVEENGLEFFNIGGDPAELMAFMVKNPGLMPGMDALKSGEITKRRKGIEEIVLGCWRSCIETGDGLGPAPRFERRSKVDAERDESPAPLPEDPGNKPFVADAIIANPPSFAHIHVAEKLGVPLHLMFTMPWSPTRAFPQPLANIQSSNTDAVTTNYVSYALVEMMTWQGLGDVINRFRTKILDLEPLSILWAPAVLTRLRVPYTYCWSPALIPKPNDWGQHIDIAGFYFLNLASSYTPDPELAAFLAAGPPPVYIGFGSIVVDDPNGLTRTIFDAVAETGVRALVSKGWGGLGADSVGIPDGVFMLGNVPHDWLFQHVSAVCHHGGAGTTAAGINAGKPTIVVPFFGDQPFWGAMVAKAGAGPEPIPYKKLTGAALAEAIRVATKPETLARARELGEKIREEKGTDVGAQYFHKHLNVDRLRCSLAPSRVAVWRLRRTQVFLSALAGATLVNNGYLRYSDLKLFRANEYSTEDHPTDPISACTSALLGDMGTIAMSMADFPRELFKAAVPKSKSSDKVGDDSTTVASSETNNGTPSLKPGDSTTTLAASDSLSMYSNPLAAASENTISTPLAPITSTGTGHSRAPSGTPSVTHRNRTDSHKSGTASPNLLSNENFENAIGAGKSINTIVATGMKSPMNFCLGLARGFRNAPTLYNDDTVRPAEKVTDFASGLKIAGKEFGFGMFDGITGLVTQPLRGAEKEGAMGALKGFSKGIGGLMLKPAAAIWSIPAYTMQGVHAEIRTLFAQSAQKYIIAARIAQSQDDFVNSSPEEREDIEVRWISQKEKMKGFYSWKQKEKGKARDDSPASSNHGSAITEQIVGNEPPKTGWLNTRNLSYEERKKLQEQKKAWKKKRAEAAATGGTFIEELPTANSSRNDVNFEEAILTAVRETSRGDAFEDSRVEQAIRSSVRLLRSRSTTLTSLASTASRGTQGTQDSGYISMIDPRRTQPNYDIKQPIPVPGPELPPRISEDLMDITEEEYQALIEQAVQLSMAEEQGSGVQRHDVDSSEDEDFKRALERSQTDRSTEDQSEEDYKKAIQASETERGSPDEEEELRKAIEASQVEQTQGVTDDDEMRRAIEESEKAHKEQLARASTLRTEEDIVLEYVKKQSLAEEEFRKAKGKQADTAVEDEELRRALEESLKTESGVKRGGGGGGGPSQF
ncbi:glycosyltransferase family 1 protein [Annulohypoxylon maeteangense]|uniref:glycosyltransferase family 1 protein n=1 Tax=Annulohypoxylon maeteangense TaxID=1927788 RepID=UPI0020072FAC|nr:glycosyltransferase family 1 protein [Annulohypoxylon maeteangense]KAI0881589.1 glycosyltransferase family 1 protein [Annulohypoxylon maeteangense]